MATPSLLTFSQNIFRSIYPDIIVSACHEDDIQANLPDFFKSIEDDVIGLAPLYTAKCRLDNVALASKTRVLIVTMAQVRKAKAKKMLTLGPHESLRSLLCHPTIIKCAFQMDKLASTLFLDFNIHITAAKDLLSVSKADRLSLQSFMTVLGGELSVNRNSVKHLCNSEDAIMLDSQTLGLQAWAAFSTAILPDMKVQLQIIPSINTEILDNVTLGLVSRTIRTGSKLMAMKPTRMKNEITSESATNSGEVKVKSERYKTRVRANGGQEIRLNAIASDGTISAYTGRATDVTGRLATLSINGDIRTLEVQSVETVGRPRLNIAEALRQRILLSILQGTISLGSFPFVSAIFSTKQISWKDSPKLTSSPALYFPTGRTLNDSQTKAVNAILSNDDANRVIIVHGPPGTGKTTVIAASVTSIMAEPDITRTIWLLAHSNVAVKNIAEKLASVDFLDFRILVNKEFHFDWHEHLYTKIENNLIRSDDLVTDSIATERQLRGSKVILCTLNMLANDRLDGITQLVPIDIVIIDEASQIEVGNFLPMVVRFRTTLRQLVFVGDDKQLPPYAASEIKELDSIFEMRHLRERTFFLDTQYRMPIPLGDFISKHVYDGRLKSKHLIMSPQCCSFVDVSDGREESQQHSWKNIREAAVVVAITKQLTDCGKSFRIITPYDSQRSLIESSLKHANLPWEDKCFNVDSFQGNEDDYIVISLVRSNKLGFLQEMQRVNVMLTRSKRGMIICTSRNFLEGPAADSLVGILRKSDEFRHVEWLDGRQVQFEGLQSFL